MRDPYGLYARRVLRLRELEPLDADPGAADRGNLIHAVLAEFVRTGPDPRDAGARDHLLDIGRAAFRRFGHMPQVRALWWPRFERIAAWFIQREADERDDLVRSLVETDGRMMLDAPGGTFEIHGRADRIDVLPTGDLRIVDYKTGGAPTIKEVEAGYAPQLPLEAAIAGAGGFGDLGQSQPVALQYWRLSGGREPAKIAEATRDVAGTTQRTLARLDERIRAFDAAGSFYRAMPYPPKSPRYNPYVHLERVAAWREDEGG
jgi:ATP-dependent helicase/nuclease subunit B